MRPALVILAAGRSQRLGECKATARIGAQSAIEHLLDAASDLFDESALVVTGADDARIARVLGERAERVHNARWEEGRSGGLALAATRRAGRDLCIAPVDCPLAPRAIFAALLARWEEAGAPERGWLAPRGAHPGEGARDGHPIVIGRALAAELAGLAPGASLRELRARAAPRLALAVDEPAIHDDLDTPEDLARLRAREAAAPRSGTRRHAPPA